MAWLRITLDCASHDPDLLSELLSAAGAEAVTFEDAADQAVLEPLPGETRLWRHTQVSGLFAADADSAVIIDNLRHAVGDPTLQPTVTTVEDQNWERAWMDRFEPLLFGRRLWVCPHWRTPPKPEDVIVMLDPGLAFGTGTHPTTALCLEWLDGHDIHNKTVIDYGCGSGILAIAAAKLGARQVWAVDYDPQALTATANNAEANAVSLQISLHEPDSLPEMKVDILLANILAGPLLELAPRIAQLVRPGGQVVLSGILAEQAPAVMEKYQVWFNMEPTATREEWVRLSGQRRNADLRLFGREPRSSRRDSSQFMYTHCSYCGTVFRIHAEQLAQARGQVRCGVCSNCFNALETLTEQLAPFPAIIMGEEEESVTLTHAWESSVVSSVPASESAAPPPLEQAVPALAINPTEFAPAQHREQTTTPLSAQPDSALPDLGIIAAEPRPITVTERSSNWIKTTLWAAVNITLILTLLGQYAYFNRNELSQYPELRPLLIQLCAVMTCDTPLQRDVSRIVLANRIVESHPRYPNALLIDATLVNEADFPQPFPLLEIRFSDLNNQLVASRRFRPSEYLPPGTSLQGGMTPHQPAHVILETLDPGKDAVSFEFNLL